MHIDVQFRPGNAAARVSLAANESFSAEGGAMIAMSGHVGIRTDTVSRGGGGVMKGLRRMLAGESFFLNHFTANGQPGEVWIAPKISGDILVRELRGESLIVQGGSYLANAPGIDVDLGWAGMRTLLSGEHLFWVKLSGVGPVVLSSFGAIYPVEVNGEVIVDTGHIVAFEESLQFTITKAGKSWMSSFLGGEGLVCKFHGRGTVWCQSHNPNSFGQALGPLLKAR